MTPADREAQAREIWHREAETAPRVDGWWDPSAALIRAMLAYGEVRAGEERERAAKVAENLAEDMQEEANDASDKYARLAHQGSSNASRAIATAIRQEPTA